MQPAHSIDSASRETQVDQQYHAKSRLNVLLVDADSAHAVFVRHMLNDAAPGAFQIRWATRIETAIEYLDEERFDVVLLDLVLPGCGVLESLVRLCAIHPHLPVVVATDIDDKDLANMALQRGAQDYLIKGRFNGETLARSLRSTIDRQHHLPTEQQILEALESERRSLALDLHDGVIQTLITMRLQMQVLAKQLRHEKVDAANTVSRLADDARSAIDEVRAISHGLHPSTLDKQCLFDALLSYAERFQSTRGIRVEVDGGGGGSLDRAAKGHLYRICQECLRNANKHGKASEVLIRLEDTPRATNLEVADNGRGFDTKSIAAATEGLGFVSIRERANSMGAAVVIESEMGRGTTIRVALPAVAMELTTVDP